MASYTLSNGVVVLNVNFARPKPNASPTHWLLPHTDTTRTPILHFSTSSEVDEAHNPLTPGYQISAMVKMQGFSQQRMQENDCRLMQLVEIKSFAVDYAGRKNADGMISWKFNGNITNKILLDCVTRPDLSGAVNFPFYNASPTSRLATDYFALMSDTPGFRSTTDEWNTKTDRWNYLWRFRSEAEFLTYVMFVHKDGKREPLEGWSWTLTREVHLRWRSGKPWIYNISSRLKPADTGTVLPTGTQKRALLIDPTGMKIANIVGNNAQQGFRTSTDVDFTERDSYADGVDELFWV